MLLSDPERERSMATQKNETHIVKVSINGEIVLPSYKSLFIEMYFGGTLLSSGTAFLVARDQQSHCCLITNRHNVTGRHQQTNECISKNAAIPDTMVIYFHKAEGSGEWIKVRIPLYRDDESPYWFEHSTLGANVDVVAMNLSWGSDAIRVPYYLSKKSELDRRNMIIGPAETVSVIGFPFGLSTAGKFPVWATGFLAQDLSLMSDATPYFLIDCRTRQGQSGSAVIAYRPQGYRYESEGRIHTALMTAPAWEFLGIYSGRVNAESDLGIVWSVDVIEDIYETAERDQLAREAKSAPPKTE